MSKHLETQRPHVAREKPVHLLSRFDEFFGCGVCLSVGNICKKNQGEAIESNAGLVNKKAVFRAAAKLGNYRN
jgi:hypothetical protein